jgi:hypothetical protein
MGVLGLLFDGWSLIHLFEAYSLVFWAYFINPGRRFPIAWLSLLRIVIGVTVGWELFESYTGVFQGPHGGESFLNRWIGDPLCNLAGAFTAWWVLQDE